MFYVNEHLIDRDRLADTTMQRKTTHGYQDNARRVTSKAACAMFGWTTGRLRQLLRKRHVRKDPLGFLDIGELLAYHREQVRCGQAQRIDGLAYTE